LERESGLPSPYETRFPFPGGVWLRDLDLLGEATGDRCALGECPDLCLSLEAVRRLSIGKLSDDLDTEELLLLEGDRPLLPLLSYESRGPSRERS